LANSLFLGDGEWIRVVAPAFNGDAWWGIYTDWGSDLVLDIAYFQIEAGAFPTSYIPTTTAAVTRSADFCSISGAGFAEICTKREGSFVIDLAAEPSSAKKNALGLMGEWQSRLTASTAGNWDFEQSGQASPPRYPFIAKAKIGLGFGTGSSMSINGGAASLAHDGLTGLNNYMGIGNDGGYYLNGTIASLSYYNDQISADTLIELTKP
jgi:hypothetical protein